MLKPSLAVTLYSNLNKGFGGSATISPATINFPDSASMVTNPFGVPSKGL